MRPAVAASSSTAATVTVTNSTISGNQVSLTGAASGDNGGGGIYNAGGDDHAHGHRRERQHRPPDGNHGNHGQRRRRRHLLRRRRPDDHEQIGRQQLRRRRRGAGRLRRRRRHPQLWRRRSPSPAPRSTATRSRSEPPAAATTAPAGSTARAAIVTVTSSSIDGNTSNVTDTSTSGTQATTAAGVAQRRRGHQPDRIVDLPEHRTVYRRRRRTTATAAARSTTRERTPSTRTARSRITPSRSTGRAADGGGAIHTLGGGTATDATIAGNSINQPGGAIFTGSEPSSFRNTIIADNCAAASARDVRLRRLQPRQREHVRPRRDRRPPNTDPQLGPLQNNGGPDPHAGAARRTAPPSTRGRAPTPAPVLRRPARRGSRPQPLGRHVRHRRLRAGASEPADHRHRPRQRPTRARRAGKTSTGRRSRASSTRRGSRPRTSSSMGSTRASGRRARPRRSTTSAPARSPFPAIRATHSGVGHRLEPGAERALPRAGGGRERDRHDVRARRDVQDPDAAPPPPPAPALGRSENAKPVSGHVFVLIAGRLVPLTETRKLPSGTTVDARRGSLELIAASKKRHKHQTGVFGGAIFKLTQSRAGVSTLALREGAFKGAPLVRELPRAQGARRPRRALEPSPTDAALAAPAATSARGGATPRAPSAEPVDDERPLRRDAHRRPAHSVLVTDLVKNITVLVKAGHHYLARPRR